MGTVCITAASPGEYGWCNSKEGSFLSYYFVSTLQNAQDDITWQELFQTVSDKTFEITDRMYKNRRIFIFCVDFGRVLRYNNIVWESLLSNTKCFIHFFL